MDNSEGDQQMTMDGMANMGRQLQAELERITELLTQRTNRCGELELENRFLRSQNAELTKRNEEYAQRQGYLTAQLEATKQNYLSTTAPTPTRSPSPVTGPTDRVGPIPTPLEPTRHTKLPDPPVFTGDTRKDEISLDVWKIKVMDKLQQDSVRYPTGLAQLRYVFSRVSGVAQSQLEAYAENNYQRALDRAAALPTGETYRVFFDILDNAFGDPDRTYTARTALDRLYQGRRTFAEYYAEFMRYASRTGYDDGALQHKLRSQLSRELGQALSYQFTEPKSLEELVRICQGLDNRQRAEQQRTQSRQQQSGVRTAPLTTRITASVSGGPTTLQTEGFTGSSNPQTLSTASGTHAGPMDTSTGKTRAKWVSAEVIAARKANGQCIRCGSKSHFIKQCMLLPALRPQESRINVGHMQIPADAETEDTDLEESKNE